MTWWIWVLAAFLLLATEFVSTTMHVGFFAAGAFLVGALVGFGWQAPLWEQLLVFTVTSLVAFFIFRPMIMKKLRLTGPGVVVDTLIGEEAVTMDEIAPRGRGNAELRGTTWAALNVGETSLAKGQRCTVEQVDGLLLHVKA